MTFIPVRKHKPGEWYEMHWGLDDSFFCPHCWANLWKMDFPITGGYKVECRDCGRHKETFLRHPLVDERGRINLKYNPLDDDGDFPEDPRMETRWVCRGCREFVEEDAECHPFDPDDPDNTGQVGYGMLRRRNPDTGEIIPPEWSALEDLPEH